MAPPFAAFPPPPPPQNGLPGTEFGPGTMFGAGGQVTAEVGAGSNGAPAAPSAANISVSCQEAWSSLAELVPGRVVDSTGLSASGPDTESRSRFPQGKGGGAHLLWTFLLLRRPVTFTSESMYIPDIPQCP